MSKDRVETFSDGVFAIVLTLLVLELRVPDIANHSSLSQYAAAMRPLIPKAVSFALTFVIRVIDPVRVRERLHFIGLFPRGPAAVFCAEFDTRPV